ncbi:MAG: Asp-tRNA(Asn)/Glu-tRNA(Gln) amidotransferase subunit GatC [Coxiellaceae bacterium]|nr:Asp-tRNA(Asn)/Glu-tRNA(Gln) amidotransferase subunit GatC [Coxiellaceae bacterium]
MSTLTQTDIEKIAELSKLQFSAEKTASVAQKLDNIITLVKKMDSLDTSNTLPLAHPLNVTQPMRPDCVTEQNERDRFQKHAPRVEAGLYIVPKFVESE